MIIALRALPLERERAEIVRESAHERIERWFDRR
jgi:hypothetical protein